MNITYQIIVESICLGSDKFGFSYVSFSDFGFFRFDRMKLKLNTALQSFLKVVEFRLHIVGPLPFI